MEHDKMQKKHNSKPSRTTARQQANNPQHIPPSPMAPISQPNARSDESSHNGKIEHKPDVASLDWSNKLSLAFDGILVVTALIGWYYVHKQLKLTEQSNQVATHALEESRKANDLYREDLEITNRAWVTVLDAKLTGSLDSDPMILGVAIENTGRVPAEHIQVKVERRLQREHFTVDITEDIPTSMSLSPGQKCTGHMKFPKLTQGEFDSIKNGEVAMTIRGIIVYSDHFATHGNHHLCFRWDRDLSLFVACPVREQNDNDHH